MAPLDFCAELSNLWHGRRRLALQPCSPVRTTVMSVLSSVSLKQMYAYLHLLKWLRHKKFHQWWLLLHSELNDHSSGIVIFVYPMRFLGNSRLPWLLTSPWVVAVKSTSFLCRITEVAFPIQLDIGLSSELRPSEGEVKHFLKNSSMNKMSNFVWFWWSLPSFLRLSTRN